MKFLHRTMFASLSLLVACNPQGASNNPDAGKYDDYYSEKPSGEETAAADTAGEDGVTPNGYDPSLYEDVPSITDPAKKKKRRKGKIDKKKQARKKGKNKKNRKNKKQKNKFAVALDGVLPTAAPKGSLVEIFGSGLDQKDLVVMIDGKEQKIVEAAEDRVVIQAKGGQGKVQLGKMDKAGKFKSFAKTDFKFETLGKAKFGVRKNPDQGLIGNVYAIDGEVTELPQFEGEPIALIGVDNLNYNIADFKPKIGGRNEWFGVHFRGSLNITESGDYQFCMNSDDGAQLYLDEGLVLDNDGVHEAKEVCESFGVEAGEYQFDLIWFQASAGPMALELTWSKDGGAKEPIPASAFFPPEDAADLARG